MGSLADALARAVAKTLKAFGQSATCSRSIGSMDVSSGMMSAETVTFLDVKVTVQTTRLWTPGEGSKAGYKIIIEKSAEYEPQIGDTVSVGSLTITLSAVTPLSVGDGVAAYDCRGAE